MNITPIWSPLDDAAAQENALTDEQRAFDDAWYDYASEQVEIPDIERYDPFPEADFDGPSPLAA